MVGLKVKKITQFPCMILDASGCNNGVMLMENRRNLKNMRLLFLFFKFVMLFILHQLNPVATLASDKCCIVKVFGKSHGKNIPTFPGQKYPTYYSILHTGMPIFI